MNPLKTLARNVAAAASSIVPQGVGGLSNVRERRQRIKTAAQAAEFQRDLADSVQSLPAGPRRDAVVRQRDAAEALRLHLEAAEEHERLKKAIAADLKTTNASIDALRSQAADAEQRRAREERAVHDMAQRMEALQLVEQSEQRQASQRVAAARLALEGAVRAADAEQEAQAAEELSRATVLASARPTSLRLETLRSELDRARGELTKATAEAQALHIALLRETSNARRLEANAALVDATLAMAAWSAAANAAGLGLYASPSFPFGQELRYDMPTLPHQWKLAWNRSAMLLDDRPFEVDVAALQDDPPADMETQQIPSDPMLSPIIESRVRVHVFGR